MNAEAQELVTSAAQQGKEMAAAWVLKTATAQTKWITAGQESSAGVVKLFYV